jgi:hypothetical protein
MAAMAALQFVVVGGVGYFGAFVSYSLGGKELFKSVRDSFEPCHGIRLYSYPTELQYLDFL